MEKQQTAVEWFFDNLKNHEIQAQHFELYRQALDMEKQQMKETFKLLLKAHVDDDLIVFSNKILDETFEDYYNETFKNK
jgi:hypothetical protein